MIFDTHANVLSHIVKRRLEGEREVVNTYHIPLQLEGYVTGGIWTYSSGVSQKLSLDLDQVVSSILEELKQTETVQLVTSRDDWDNQSINIILGLQGLSMIKDTRHLEQVYELGFRHASLTHDINETNHFVSDSESLGRVGLTDLGRALIGKMNELGMVIDISGINPQAVVDIFTLTASPIIASCSNCYSLTPVSYNLKDEEIKLIAKKDGIIGVTAAARLLTQPTVESFVDHIDYLKKLIGVRHISLGFNFMNYLDVDTAQLDKCKDVTQTASIIDELYKRKYSSFEVEAIASINAKRVINKILK